MLPYNDRISKSNNRVFFDVAVPSDKHTQTHMHTKADMLCFSVQTEVKSLQPEWTEAAQAELLSLCEEQYAQLEKVRPSFTSTCIYMDLCAAQGQAQQNGN